MRLEAALQLQPVLTPPVQGARGDGGQGEAASMQEEVFVQEACMVGTASSVSSTCYSGEDAAAAAVSAHTPVGGQGHMRTHARTQLRQHTGLT